jgi:hypothetical protein
MAKGANMKSDDPHTEPCARVPHEDRSGTSNLAGKRTGEWFPPHVRREPALRIPVGAAHACWLGALLFGCAGSAPPAVPGASAATEPALAAVAAGEPAAPPITGFSRTSPLNRPLPADVPLAPNSPAIVANLAADKNGGFAVWPLMTETFSAPIYVAPPGTPKRRWSYDNCSQASGLHPPFGEALAAVPTLPGMVVSNGTDNEIAIYEPSTDTYWDFWRAKVDDRGQWSACWGGKIERYSQNPGVFEPPLGATATGVALGAFLIRIEELQRGHIEHAVNIATVRTRAGCQSYPANRNDGNTEGEDIACEGQRFRLDPSFDASALKSPAARTIARAMQRYGLILTDKSDALITQAEDPRPYLAKNAGKNPYDELLGGVPWYLVLNDVPVERLQALPLDYGKP